MIMIIIIIIIIIHVIVTTIIHSIIDSTYKYNLYIYEIDLPSVNGVWTDWSDWGSCGATCGEGVEHKRIRSCTDPAPSCYGDQCDGDSEIAENCNLTPCPGRLNY
jgi:hypothetical protein